MACFSVVRSRNTYCFCVFLLLEAALHWRVQFIADIPKDVVDWMHILLEGTGKALGGCKFRKTPLVPLNNVKSYFPPGGSVEQPSKVPFFVYVEKIGDGNKARRLSRYEY